MLLLAKEAFYIYLYFGNHGQSHPIAIRPCSFGYGSHAIPLHPPKTPKSPHICLLFRLGGAHKDCVNPSLLLLPSTLFPTAEEASPHLGIDFR